VSERDENRARLEREAERHPDGWEAQWIELYGLNGALDLLEAQSGNAHGINLTRRPFAGDEQLKGAVRDARYALSTLARLAYERWWADTEELRARRAEAKERTDEH
jgi:hypothetical protein